MTIKKNLIFIVCFFFDKRIMLIDSLCYQTRQHLFFKCFDKTAIPRKVKFIVKGAWFHFIGLTFDPKIKETHEIK